MKYTLSDIFIVPAPISVINSRSECIPTYKNGMLPLFTAPMSSVVNLSNYELFNKNGIQSILPRTVSLTDRKNICKKNWCAFSLNEFEDICNSDEFESVNEFYVLIDIANGHMMKLHNLIRQAKEKYGNKIKIMAGNIANPETYRLLSDAGADFIRLGVGTGNACITSSNTSIHYPIASLIKECSEISDKLEKPAYIVADGGVKGYSDIIKCLALGADYVMCGYIFAKMAESAGEFANCNNYDEAIHNLKSSLKVYKKYYGMSTKKAQIEINGRATKTSEGIEKIIEVEYTMEQWIDNFKDYLKSAMSYCSMYELHEFIGNPEIITVTTNSHFAINK